MERKEIRSYPNRFLTTVHDKDYVNYLAKACASVPENKSVYPYVFPIRNASRKPKEMAVRAGYYCIDTFTPLNANAYKVMLSFLFILVGNFFFIFVFLAQSFYVIGELFLLLGFLLLLSTYRKVVRA